MELRLIGDLHGLWRQYVTIASEAERTIQIGDFGYDYSILNEFDSEHHKIIGGNHEDYPPLLEGKVPHYLGDYGMHLVPGWGEIFFVRGGHSIDKTFREPKGEWFFEEELSMKQCYDALDSYANHKPAVMITHECPQEIIPYVGNPDWNITPSRTSQILQTMFNEHRPVLWVFGHHHRSWTEEVKGTQFVCLPELGHIDI